MPLDPISSGAVPSPEWSVDGAARGPEWSVESVDGATGADAPERPGSTFGNVLTSQLANLEGTQNQAAEAARALATGSAADPSSAVVAIDRARLAMQLAATLRTKGVEAAQEILRTQV